MVRHFALTVAFASVTLLLPLVAQGQSKPPDLTGTYDPYRGGGGGGKGGKAAADPKLTPPPAGPLVLKPQYQKAYDERRALEAAATARGEALATGGSQCVPYGMPTMLAIATYPTEVIQTPTQITIITEAFSEVRRIYLDRPQLPIDDVAPGYYGRSVGHWEGDTLVVDTVGIKTTVAGYRGMPHSEQMRISERIKLVSPDVMHDEITITDPVVLEKPVTYTLGFRRAPKYEMVEFVCDNNREYTDEKGIVRLRVK